MAADAVVQRKCPDGIADGTAVAALLHYRDT
jgi:hypothetical protein